MATPLTDAQHTPTLAETLRVAAQERHSAALCAYTWQARERNAGKARGYSVAASMADALDGYGTARLVAVLKALYECAAQSEHAAICTQASHLRTFHDGECRALNDAIAQAEARPH